MAMSTLALSTEEVHAVHADIPYIDGALSTKELGLIKWQYFIDLMINPPASGGESTTGPTLSEDDEEATELQGYIKEFISDVDHKYLTEIRGGQ